MGNANGTVSTASRSMDDSVWFDRGVRIGLLAYGLIHLLIGWLALQLAFGDRAGAPNQQGALQQVAEKPLGSVLLWVVAAGLVVLAAWQAAEALVGHRDHTGAKRYATRLGSATRVVVYLVLAFSAARTALHAGSGGRRSEDHLTAQIMELPGGRLLIGAVGVGVIVAAVALGKKGITSSFEKDLQWQGSSGSSGNAVRRLGQVGHVAKGVALAVVGGLLIWAAWTYDPRRAGSLDVALRLLLDESVGPWLLAAVAAGIVCFGLYCFAWGRYADTSRSRHK